MNRYTFMDAMLAMFGIIGIVVIGLTIGYLVVAAIAKLFN
jgi:hypothetical protein